jgi:hypothetical protein
VGAGAAPRTAGLRGYRQRGPADEPDSRRPRTRGGVCVEETLVAEPRVRRCRHDSITSVIEPQEMELPGKEVSDAPALRVDEAHCRRAAAKNAADARARNVRHEAGVELQARPLRERQHRLAGAGRRQRPSDEAPHLRLLADCRPDRVSGANEKPACAGFRGCGARIRTLTTRSRAGRPTVRRPRNGSPL